MNSDKEFLQPIEFDPATGEAKIFLLTEEDLYAWMDEHFAPEIAEFKGEKNDDRI